MKLEKAIEILNDSQRDLLLPLRGEFLVALKLGIEALRAIQRHQRGGRVTQIYLLPGETKE